MGGRVAAEYHFLDDRVLDFPARRGTLSKIRQRRSERLAAVRPRCLGSSVAALDAIFLPAIEPAALLGLEVELMEAVAAQRRPPTLLIHSAPNPALALGRYHLYAGDTRNAGMLVFRRITGGRAVSAGPGWIWVAIVAPRTNVIVAPSGRPLGPEQVINRHVRGMLGGLRAMGIDCSYPGRDAITSKQREIAMCSFESDRSGVILFEAALAVTRGMTEFVRELDRIGDTAGITCPAYDSERATTVQRELGRAPGFEEIAHAICAACASLAGRVSIRELGAAERDHAIRRGAQLEASGWLRREASGPFNRAGRIASQLGAIQANLEVTAEGRIASAMLSGEFIANSAGLEQFECALRGLPLEREAVEAAAAHFLGAPGNFLLGLGAPAQTARSLAHLIVEA
jgi:lipoate-protein ligase A